MLLTKMQSAMSVNKDTQHKVQELPFLTPRLKLPTTYTPLLQANVRIFCVYQVFIGITQSSQSVDGNQFEY